MTDLLDDEHRTHFNHGTGRAEISPDWAVLAIRQISAHLGFDPTRVPKISEFLRSIDQLKEFGSGLGVSLDVYRSGRDGTVVVHVDTDGLPENERGPKLRIYLNDDTENPVYDEPLETGDPYYCNEEFVDA